MITVVCVYVCVVCICVCVVVAAGAVVLAFRRGRVARRAARRGGMLELDTPQARAVLQWTCMVCGRSRPDPDIAVASRTAGWLTINVRFCADSDSCREAAVAKADSDVRRFSPRG